MIDDQENVLVEATMDQDGFPAVLVQYDGHSQVMSSEDARRFGVAILGAIAIAENDEVILAGIFSLEQIEADGSRKGFGKKAAVRPQDGMGPLLLQLTRQFRPELPFGLEAIVAFRNLKAKIGFPWGDRESNLQFEADEAKSHAFNLITAAEAAETDGFLRHFVTFKLGLSEVEAQGMVSEFRDFRERVRLEGLLKKAGPDE
jgi:hypothetical protein